jgi:hypothetical protein
MCHSLSHRLYTDHRICEALLVVRNCVHDIIWCVQVALLSQSRRFPCKAQAQGRSKHVVSWYTQWTILSSQSRSEQALSLLLLARFTILPCSYAVASPAKEMWAQICTCTAELLSSPAFRERYSPHHHLMTCFRSEKSRLHELVEGYHILASVYHPTPSSSAGSWGKLCDIAACCSQKRRIHLKGVSTCGREPR